MKEFVEKLIERLMKDKRIGRMSFGATVEIVNQLAEEYKGNLSENLTSSETSITNADKIRAMDDSELAGWISNLVRWSEDGEAILSIWDASTKSETRIHDSCGDVLEWLQSEV